ncbi:hypothetical protein HGRIS_005819 [Hohenbuehelia grisea]|uniref:Uncharacterized protein n=1 Tax=Hohenbuehelia grisea TaxID=104357 RepID=A0ABR3JZW9_9AGAR
MSGSDDGCIIVHDGRAGFYFKGSQAQATLMLDAEITGLQFHPEMDHIFVTSDHKGSLCLRDMRMAFGTLSQRRQSGIVQIYNTKLSKRGVNHISNPEATSVTFDSTGNKLAVTLMHYLPTIYSLSDPNPIATCSGKYLPDGQVVPVGQRTFSDSCTMKHGSFGSLGADEGQFYTHGSDDFRGYLWRLPVTPKLQGCRQEFSADEWEAGGSSDTVAFVEHPFGSRHQPVEISTPHCRLTGHNSIVNNALFHPFLPHIVTSGIENHITLHSPKPYSPCFQGRLNLSPQDVRELPTGTYLDRDFYYRNLEHQLGPVDLDELQTIRLFDQILRQEEMADVFEARRWVVDDDDDV